MFESNSKAGLNGARARRLSVLAAAAGAAVAATSPLTGRAAVFNWDGGGVNTNFSTANNWNPNTAPTSNDNNDLTFGISALQSPSNTTATQASGGSFTLNTITFDDVIGLTSFIVNSSGGGSLLEWKLSDAGVIQDSNANQTLSAAMKIGDALTLSGSGSGIVSLGAIDTAGKAITKTGASTFSLTGALTNPGSSSTTALTIGNGTVGDGGTIASSLTNLGTIPLRLRGGVLSTSGSFTRALNSDGSLTSSQFNWGAGGGGFAAFGGALTVDLALTSQTWASTAGFVAASTPLVFGSAVSDNIVTYTNSIVLGTAGTATREIRVNDNGGSTADYARITGNLTSSGGTMNFSKTGTGLLELNGSANNYNGTTTVSGGTLLVTGTHTGGAAYSVGADATLGGTGSIGSSITAAGTGPSNRAVIAPGNPYNAGMTTLGTGVGQLNVTGTVTFNDNSRLSVQLNNDTKDLLNVTGTVNLASISADDLTVQVAGTQTLGKYTVVQATSVTGTFATSTGVPSNYRVAYTPTTVDLQHRAVQSFALTAPAGTPNALVGQTIGASGTLSNTAPTDSSSLAVALSSTGTLNVSSLTATPGGPLAPGGSTSVTGTINTGATSGAAKTWQVANTDADATASTSTIGGTVNVFQSASVTGNTPGPLGAGGLATVTNAASSDGGQRASAFLDGHNASGHFSVTGVTNGATNTGASTNAATSFSGTVAFASAGRLNGDHTGSLSLTLENDQSVLGATNQDLGSLQWDLLETVSGNSGSQSSTLAAGDLGSLTNSIYAVSDQELATVATLLDGTLSSETTVATSWRARNANEKYPTQTTPPVPAESFGLVSDVLTLDMGGSTDAYVLQLSYDESAFPPFGSDTQAASQGLLYLARLNENGPGPADDLWGRAATGTYAGDVAYNGGFFTLGTWGVDTSSNVVWAVVTGSGQFSVVPEPTGAAALALAGVGMLARRRRRRAV